MKIFYRKRNNFQRKLIFLFIFPFCAFSQLDTNTIFREINELNNDSLIGKYWQNLHDADQKDHTDSKENAIRLFKSTYLIQKKGFPLQSDFGTIIHRTPLLLFIHNMSVEMNILTFSSLKSYKGKLEMKSTYPNYFMQNVLFWFYGIETEHTKLFANSQKKLESKKFNLQELIKVTNETLNYYDFSAVEITNTYETVVYGTKQEAKILKKNNKYYFVSDEKFQQILLKNEKYYFSKNIDNSYFLIDENKNLVLKSKNQLVLNTYFLK